MAKMALYLRLRRNRDLNGSSLHLDIVRYCRDVPFTAQTCFGSIGTQTISPEICECCRDDD